MLVTYFRSSSYNQWDYCQMSYFITYNLGYLQPTQQKANLGTITHKVLECLAQCKKRIQYRKNANMSIDDGELGKISFTTKSLETDTFVEELLQLSYDYYVKADPAHEYGKKEYKFCKDMVQAAIDWNQGQFDPRNRTIIATEPHFDIPIKEDWATFTHENGEKYQLAIKGTIDLVTEADEETIEVIDWKTGQRKDWATGEVKDYKKLQNDPQLLLYHYAISKLYPNYNNTIMSIFFLRDGGPFSMCYDESDKDRFIEMLRKRFNEITRNKLPKPINPWRSDFRCKRLCPFYKNNWEGSEKTMCNYVEDHIKVYGIETTCKDLKRKDFTVGHYQAPGSVESKDE